MAINVICVNSHNYLGRGIEYTNILYDMVRRNLPDDMEGGFVCFTDILSQEYHPNIRQKLLPEGLKGWWNKLAIFRQGLFPEGDTNIYIDLDTVITGALDDIAAYKGDFAMLTDFYHPRIAAGGIMIWRGDKSFIWDKWIEEGAPEDNGSPLKGFGEAAWIQSCLKPERLQDIFPHKIVSYKIHAKTMIPDKSSIVCFHGLPRLHEVRGWVQDFWKIGGANTFHSKVVGNTSEGELIANIRHSITLGLDRLKAVEPHAGHAVIVGGGPSLKDELEGLRERYINGQKVFSTNGTYKFLTDNDIIPHAHIMLDARPEMANMVGGENRYYASQCHPKVFELSPDAILWHHFATDITSILPKDAKNEPLVGGGSSVGLKAISIAHILGFRHMHLYGFDSSYRDDAHHAYGQPLNDDEKILDIVMNGVSYRAAPWMCTQVEEFKEMLPHLLTDTILTVHGEGLLPDTARLMSA